MSDVLSKIRALVARARAGGSEEESRTSAVQACRLILEHKIVLSMPGAPPEERSDEELREAALEYIRRKRGEENYRPRSYSSPNATRARASAYARAYAYEDEERGRHTTHTPIDPTSSPRSVAPFDPYEASFETVRDFAKERGFDLHDNGDGSYSAHCGGSWCKGSWRDVLAFVFGLLERGSAKVVWRQM